MDIEKTVANRRSIRAFSQEPIPKKTLEYILERALRAPSWGNTQPWHFTVVGGSTLKQIGNESAQLVQQGVPINPDLSFPDNFNETQTMRYKELGKGLFSALGIAREDKEARTAHFLQMIGLSNVPHVIYLHFDKGFNPYGLVDGGLILQTIALLALEKGLGTCILAVSVAYPDVLRKLADIPSDQVLVMGIAIGHPLPDHPSNQFRSERGELKEFVRFIDVA